MTLLDGNKKKVLALAVATGMLGMGAGSALAAGVFNDVPEGHLFEGPIEAVAGAGIAEGFPDGGYHPADEVTRQSMAAFLERGLGRVGFTGNGVAELAANDVEETVVATTIDAGGVSGNGFVMVQVNGLVTLGVDGDQHDCPCNVQIEVRDESETVVITTAADLADRGGEAGLRSPLVDFSGQVVVPITGSTTKTFTLYATMDDVDQSGALRVEDASISALYVPFGPDGDNTLEYGSADGSSR